MSIMYYCNGNFIGDQFAEIPDVGDSFIVRVGPVRVSFVVVSVNVYSFGVIVDVE